ncbi:protein pelota [Sporothrix brasiliensis 5110]|uniref:Protein pelota n=1 Tax=Sporothrix brasiliensis 5110 TaxID=1398154 RepID=A0A0C2IXX1_9PEZI|nr:protein pelota [Sporothrix brasiliensis 5110]KIH89882.1 protein pelota [Sporothrix brasiliensis 5110]
MQLVKGKKPATTDAAQGEAGVTLLPTEPEDMWHANNLIRPGDILKATAIRKVVDESATGSTSSNRMRTELTIRVAATFFDPPSSALQVNGTIVVENPLASLGQYHTLDLELQRPFTLWKARESGGWDSVAKAELDAALRTDKGDALVAVVLGDTHNTALVVLVTEYQTLVKTRMEGSSKPTPQFYGEVLAALLEAADFSGGPRLLVLASPGFAAQKFKAFVSDQAVRADDAKLRRMGRDAVVVHANSANVYALHEALRSPEVAAVVKSAKFQDETRVMDEVAARVRQNDGRVAYGLRHVAQAVEEGAVGRGGGALLVNNALFRSDDLATRRQYVGIVDRVRDEGGATHLLSSDHESGKRLDGLGGIAALLTYPMLDPDEADVEPTSLEEWGYEGVTVI